MIRIDWYEFGPEQIATRWIQEEGISHSFMGQILFMKKDWYRIQTRLASLSPDVTTADIFKFERINTFSELCNKELPKP